MHVLVIYGWKTERAELASVISEAMGNTVFDVQQRLAAGSPIVLARNADLQQILKLENELKQNGIPTLVVHAEEALKRTTQLIVSHFEMKESTLRIETTTGRKGEISFNDIDLLLPVTGAIRHSEKKLDLERLKTISRLVKSQAIKIPEYVLFLKNYILRQYIQETKKIEGGYNFMISDRTAAKVQNLLRVSAILDGRTVVEEKDLNNLYYLVCMVGKEEERKRLKGIIDTTKKYFFDDKRLLIKLFDIMNIFHAIKSSKDPRSLVEHKNFVMIISKLEQSFVETSIRNRLMNFINKIGFRPNKSRVIHMIEIFQESCVLLREMAIKKETLELIEGFEDDIKKFNDDYLRQS